MNQNVITYDNLTSGDYFTIPEFNGLVLQKVTRVPNPCKRNINSKQQQEVIVALEIESNGHVVDHDPGTNDALLHLDGEEHSARKLRHSDLVTRLLLDFTPTAR